MAGPSGPATSVQSKVDCACTCCPHAGDVFDRLDTGLGDESPESAQGRERLADLDGTDGQVVALIDGVRSEVSVAAFAEHFAPLAVSRTAMTTCPPHSTRFRAYFEPDAAVGTGHHEGASGLWTHLPMSTDGGQHVVRIMVPERLDLIHGRDHARWDADTGPLRWVLDGSGTHHLTLQPEAG